MQNGGHFVSASRCQSSSWWTILRNFIGYFLLASGLWNSFHSNFNAQSKFLKPEIWSLKRLPYILFLLSRDGDNHFEKYIISIRVEDYPNIYKYHHISISAWEKVFVMGICAMNDILFRYLHDFVVVRISPALRQTYHRLCTTNKMVI